MTGPLIEAMLDSTNGAIRDQEEERKKREMEALRSDVQYAQQRLDELKAARETQAQQQTQVPSPVSVEAANDTAAADTLKNCEDQIAALEACKDLPGFASTVCKMTATSRFPCE